MYPNNFCIAGVNQEKNNFIIFGIIKNKGINNLIFQVGYTLQNLRTFRIAGQICQCCKYMIN